MNDELRNLVLGKIFYSFKFHNDESHEKYREIVFSPLYREFFEEVRKETYNFSKKELPASWYSPELEQGSEEFDRLKKIILGLDQDKELDQIQKIDMLNNVVFPFRLNKEQEEFFLSLFP